MKKIVLLDSRSAELVTINNIDKIIKKTGFNENEHDFGTFMEGIIDGLGYSSNDVSWSEIETFKEQNLGDDIVKHIKENDYVGINCFNYYLQKLIIII